MLANEGRGKLCTLLPQSILGPDCPLDAHGLDVWCHRLVREASFDVGTIFWPCIDTVSATRTAMCVLEYVWVKIHCMHLVRNLRRITSYMTLSKHALPGCIHNYVGRYRNIAFSPLTFGFGASAGPLQL